MSLSVITTMDLIGLILCLGFALTGYRRGAINSLIRFGGFIASFIIAKIFSPLLAGKLIQNGVLDGISSYISINQLGEMMAGIQNQDLSGVNPILNEILKNSDMLLNNQSIETVKMMLIEGIAYFISFGIIFILISVLILVVQIVLKGITSLPVIGGIDRFLGLFLGLAGGVFVCFIIVWIFSMIDLYGSENLNLLNYQSSIFYQKILVLFFSF